MSEYSVFRAATPETSPHSCMPLMLVQCRGLREVRNAKGLSRCEAQDAAFY